MKKVWTVVFLAALVFAPWDLAVANDTANQQVNFQVTEIREISVSGPANLTINTATPGSAPSDAIDASTTYAVTANEASKITATLLDEDMPSGTALYITLASGATSAGEKLLTKDVAQDVVTDITTINESGKTITYRMTATAAAGVIASSHVHVALTVVDTAG